MNKSNLEKLTQCYKNQMTNFEPFIRKVVFHNFKNIASSQELELDFPITVLIGKNGTNKSSALLALYAIRENTNLSDYWFGTLIDSFNTEEEFPRYFYTYQDPNTKEIAEVLQINNQKSSDSDYWETSRPILKDGMKLFNKHPSSAQKTKTRWRKLNKPVLYVNFKAHISAFDKYFYHSNKLSQLSNKKEVIRRGTNRLSQAIKKNLFKVKYNGSEKIINKINYQLEPEEVKIISEILGKNYSSIHYIEHRFFDKVEGGTAILNSHNLTYSEAFAGSGEYSIVSLIFKIMRCKERSLILLDEPEVSLHPSAQVQLMDFLMNQALINKHQIVISTHAPALIEGLPPSAIRLFIENQSTHKVEILKNIHYLHAFEEIGVQTEKIVIYVEDKLAHEIITRIIDQNNNLASRFTCKFYVGGGDIITTKATSVLAAANIKCIIFLDGDKKTKAYIENNNQFPNHENIPQAKLAETIENYYGKVKVYPSGSGSSNETEKNELLSQVWKFIENNVFYFNFDYPEKFIVEILDKDDKINIPDIETKDNKDYFKKRIKEYTIKEIGYGEVSSEEIFTISKTLINRIFETNPAELEEIKQMLNNYEA